MSRVETLEFQPSVVRPWPGGETALQVFLKQFHADLTAKRHSGNAGRPVVLRRANVRDLVGGFMMRLHRSDTRQTQSCTGFAEFFGRMLRDPNIRHIEFCQLKFKVEYHLGKHQTLHDVRRDLLRQILQEEERIRHEVMD